MYVEPMAIYYAKALIVILITGVGLIELNAWYERRKL